MTEITKDGFRIDTKTGKSFYFIGVTTTKSSIMKLFPLWMKELGFADVKIFVFYNPNINLFKRNYK